MRTTRTADGNTNTNKSNGNTRRNHGLDSKVRLKSQYDTVFVRLAHTKNPNLFGFLFFSDFSQTFYVPTQICFTFFNINAALSFALLSFCSDLISGNVHDKTIKVKIKNEKYLMKRKASEKN